MFLHIGSDVVVPLREVVGIIDLTEEPSQVNREFLRTAEEEGFVVQLSETPVSIVICTKTIYLSPISAKTLYKRAIDRDLGIRD
ncbi:MAG TPA: DUF370 domain-containing protein [Firmicutes bacterium]|jgi:hypothetical protein|nr:DUF370 domain-containing protein [Bacillota bacterium]